MRKVGCSCDLRRYDSLRPLPVYTYIQSRFYRSPEVILGMNYHMAIDMWSLGCILAELYTGFPIFPGENEQEQLSCIMEVLGVPDKEFINRSTRKKLFFGACCRRCVLSHTSLTFHCFRPNRCSAAMRELEGQAAQGRQQDPRAGAALRRRGLRRLHRQVPHVGPRAAHQALRGAAAPLRHGLAHAAEDGEPRAERDALLPRLVVVGQHAPQQGRAGDAEEVAHRRADAAHRAHGAHRQRDAGDALDGGGA